MHKGGTFSGGSFSSPRKIWSSSLCLDVKNGGNMVSLTRKLYAVFKVPLVILNFFLSNISILFKAEIFLFEVWPPLILVFQWHTEFQLQLSQTSFIVHWYFCT